jgi:hypothetical protein
LIGFPANRTGVNIGRKEYYFDSEGIQTTGNRTIRGHCTLVDRVLAGETSKSAKEIEACLQDLRRRFSPGKFSVVGLNCQSFNNAFASALGLEPLSWKHAGILRVLSPGLKNTYTAVMAPIYHFHVFHRAPSETWKERTELLVNKFSSKQEHAYLFNNCLSELTDMTQRIPEQM